MTDFIEIYDTEILLVEDESGSVLEYVGSAIIVGGAVQKVNGQIGDITLTAADVAADPFGSAEAVRTTLQSQINAKADTATVNQQINAINQQLPNFATQTYVLTALTPKASIVYVDNALATKADALATSQALATKATTVQLNEVKALAESNELKVSTKAEQSSVDNLSATVTAQGQTLLTKADIAALATLAQLVDTKADQAYVISEIARITGNAPAALDTLAEIAEQLGNDQTQINNLLNQIGNRVRFDAAQALTTTQQNQALSNINAEKAGTAATLVGAITPASIGAATSAQGTKADTAIQSADLAPVALSGSFSDLVNKSSLFNLVYSAYAIGSNSIIAATDTLGQMLGKLQGQISANSTAISTKADATSTLQAINTKEPSIVAGLVSQYWRGDKTWRDFATDVRGVVLTGLSTAASTSILATDTIIVGLGKAQAQINTNAATLAPVPQKVGTKWYQSGLYYDNSYPYVPGSSTVVLTTGQIIYQAFLVLEDVTFSQIGVNCTAVAAGSTIQLAVFDSDATNAPRNRLALTTALDTSTAGVKSENISVTLQKGQVIWLASLPLGGNPTVASNVYPRAIGGSTSIISTSPTAYRKGSQTNIPSASNVTSADMALTTLPRISLLAQ